MEMILILLHFPLFYSLRCQQQEIDLMNGDGDGDSASLETVVMDELVTLRFHESDLEEKLSELKDSRNHLMGQIQGLMKLLQVSIPPSSIPFPCHI